MVNKNLLSLRGLNIKQTAIGVIIGIAIGAIIAIPIITQRDQLLAELQSKIAGIPDPANRNIFDIALVDVTQEERNHLKKSDEADACDSDTPITHIAQFKHQSSVHVSITSTIALESTLFDFVTPKIQEELGLTYGETIETGGSTQKEIKPGTKVTFEADFAEIWNIGTIVNGDGQILGSFSVRSGLQYDIKPSFSFCETVAENSIESVSVFRSPQTYRYGGASTLLANFFKPLNNIIPEKAFQEPEEQTAIEQAWNFEGSNSDWTVFAKEFDGVEMVLVPKGCFTIGSTEEQLEYVKSLDLVDDPIKLNDERGGSEVCIEEPYWIDKYEVTNEQFDSFGGEAETASRYIEPDQPRQLIRWDEAVQFCSLRGGFLPTEEQWAFAARGPNALIFPWGDEFNVENVASSLNEIIPVDGDKYSGGISWVGALNMSGNVWEWTNSLYSLYGIEPDPDNTFHVIRGGAVSAGDSVHAENRGGSELRYSSVGFRCAKSVDTSTT